jgi:hypothetical protein
VAFEVKAMNWPSLLIDGASFTVPLLITPLLLLDTNVVLPM